MSDVLIRNLPDDVLAAIDAKARRVGLSRTECIRRTLSRERVEATEAVRAKDLVVFADTFAGLAESSAAWSASSRPPGSESASRPGPARTSGQASNAHLWPARPSST